VNIYITLLYHNDSLQNEDSEMA